jgi:hypothetical protein
MSLSPYSQGLREIGREMVLEETLYEKAPEGGIMPGDREPLLGIPTHPF